MSHKAQQVTRLTRFFPTSARARGSRGRGRRERRVESSSVLKPLNALLFLQIQVNRRNRANNRGTNGDRYVVFENPAD